MIEQLSDYAMVPGPYLLALGIEIVRTPSGKYYADPSWAKDLLRHLEYIDRLTLVCPAVDGKADGLDPINHPRLRIVTYRKSSGMIGAVKSLPRLASLIWKEVGKHRLVHSGVAGWPIPLGFLAVPIGRIRSRKTIVIVESAPWRSLPPTLRSRIHECLARTLTAAADFVIYTQDEYQRSLPATRAGGGVVSHATWVDEGDLVIDPATSWALKGSRPRFLFAGRMVPEKGVRTLLGAISLVSDLDCSFSFIGSGPDKALIEQCSDPRVQLLDPVRYGPAFFSIVQQHHMLVVPSTSDEQPRIVYDAFAQAVPVLGSVTAGLSACVENERTGLLVARGNSCELADAIRSVAKSPERLEEWGRNAWHVAQSNTHRMMHIRRSHLLVGIR